MTDENRPLVEARKAIRQQQGTKQIKPLQRTTPPTPPRSPRGNNDDAIPNWKLIAGVIGVIALIIIGLFLPPISLGDRLGWGETEQPTTNNTPSTANTTPTESIPGEAALNLVAGSAKLNKVSNESFTAGSAPWEAAYAAIPSSLIPVSALYTVEHNGSANGSVSLTIPGNLEPHHTLDLYGWDGTNWSFIPSTTNESNTARTSITGTLPQAYTLMRAETKNNHALLTLLPNQSLPLSLLNEANALVLGNLTLTGNGQLNGSLADKPEGNWATYMRVSNGSVVVDESSLKSFLNNKNSQDAQINLLLNQVTVENHIGVYLDYQGVDPTQKEAFNQFVASLADNLHSQGRTLAIALTAPSASTNGWDTGGQDWPTLGQLADTVYIKMPLDPTIYSENGNADQMLGWATGQIDRHKLAGSFNNASANLVGKTFTPLTLNKAMEQYGSPTSLSGDQVPTGTEITVQLDQTTTPPEWDGTVETYKFSYEQAGQKQTIWLNNERALSKRLRLAQKHQLSGINLTGLGALTNPEPYAASINSYQDNGAEPEAQGAAIVWAVYNENGDVIASSTGDSLSYQWDTPDTPGTYKLTADFSQGDTVSSLGELTIQVGETTTEAETTNDDETTTSAATPEATESATPEPAEPNLPNPTGSEGVVNIGANVRLGPGVSYGTVANGAQAGDKVTLIGRSNNSSWLNIIRPDGAEGWIFAQLVDVDPSFALSSLPVVTVDPPVVVVTNPDSGNNDDGGSTAPPPPPPPPISNSGFELGGQTHSLANPGVMSYSGMTWVKFQHKWGVGDSGEAVRARVENAHAQGFKVLLSIPGSNTYPGSIDFASYIEFLGEVAATGPDAIEVWNEMNIDFEWPAGQIDPSSYVNNMLAPAYAKIKSVNPNVMVISGAPAPTGFDNGHNAWADDRYMAGVAAAGGANYMDCIGVHHNAGATPPGQTTGHPAGTHYSWYYGATRDMYYNAFGGARPVCFTELGYLSGDDFGGLPQNFLWASGTSVAEHAQWLAEAASLSASSGKVRMMIIFNVDITHFDMGGDPQAGFSMIRPGGGCPSCDLLNQVMGGG